MSEGYRLPADRGRRIQVWFADEPIDCYDGETVAVALLAAGIHRFGVMDDDTPRQPLCNMGTCFDCSVIIDDARLVRSCLTPVRDGMHIQPERRH
ncbi:hypothetical protein GCM10022240_30260 [Microbacterium kribbense]|uniref:(2Fe-2S)-binding protein n=1 Tax=Microbacterium kribbense TaxID=433645 RepID=A0ABP7H2S6_9MICO